MALSNVALTNTFDDWRTRTNQLVTVANQVTEGFYINTGNVKIDNITWNQASGSNVSLNVSNGYIRGNGFGITAIQNSNISGTLTNSQIQNNRITITSNNAALVLEGFSAGSIALGNTVYMNVYSNNSYNNTSNASLATSFAVYNVFSIYSAANTQLRSMIASAYNQANTSPDIANTYAVVVGSSANARANVVGLSSNNFAGLMANSSNARSLANTSKTVFSGDLVVSGNIAAQNVVIKSTTLLATPIAGALEYDGTTVYGTPSTSYGRAAIPLTIYTSGSGTSSATSGALFPAAGDTITLAVGTYHITVRANVSVTGSTIPANCNLWIRGAGTAVGTLNWMGSSTISDGSFANLISIPATALTGAISVTSNTATNPRNYVFLGEGMLKITTSGTIIPTYVFAQTLTSGTTVLPAENYMIIRTIDTQSAASAGPSGSGWG